ncbi:MAG: hypothetical protein K2W95_06355 [Candidatus Obscuribacterales bacterium]|nr:hypothetical protein [Candidatus Obscuribacterales bacterium]
MSEKRTILKVNTEKDEVAEAARNLMEQVGNTSEEARKRKETPRSQAEAPSTAATASPITEDVRLKFLHEASRSLQGRFSIVDTSDNGFLGQHELNTAFHSNISIGAMLNHYPLITSLHADGFHAHNRHWISNDHLGISDRDLRALQDITSSNPADRSRFVSQRALSYIGPGLLGGGMAGTAVMLFAANGSRYRGLIGLGVGAGIAALSYLQGRQEAVDLYVGTRGKLANDTRIDFFIRQGRLP